MSTAEQVVAPIVVRIPPGEARPLVELAPRFLDLPYPAFLDSAAPDDRAGRYSYLTADPFLVATSRGASVTLDGDDNGGGGTPGAADIALKNPWGALQSLLRQRRSAAPAPGLPPFQGGAIGYWSYDLGRTLERLPTLADDDLGLPEMCVGLYDWCLAEDHRTGEVFLFTTPIPGVPRSGERRLAFVRERLRRPPDTTPPLGPAPTLPQPSANFTRQGYLRAVARVKEYLAAGDIYQANLSQRFELPFQGDPWRLYRTLRRVNPAPYAAYLETPGGTTVLSASPELFLQLSGDRVETRPIKGTRPRGETAERDRALAAELIASQKDRAENVMIVDLLRNDLGKVSRIGSVDAPELFSLEAHPTVWHLVSTVTGALQPGLDGIDLMRACFPGGSITGAPKIRAMEIIEELEPTRRGVYCGSIGYIGFNGEMSTNIAIRTMVLTRERLVFQAGGGIVADSDPEDEYEETLHKARGLMRALGHDA